MKEALNFPTRSNILGYMIAGGQASRMGGVNKALVKLDGIPMGERVLKRLHVQCDRVWVSANRDVEAFIAMGAECVLGDNFGTSFGPLAGLEALVGKLPSEIEWVLTAPCDVPYLPEGLVEFFASGLEQHRYDYVGDRTVPKIVTLSAGGHTHNTIALIHRSLLPSIRPYLARGDRKVGLWMQPYEPLVLPWNGDEAALENVNDPQSLSRLQRHGAR